MQLEGSSTPFFEYNPSWRGPGSEEDKEAKPSLLDFDLEALLELGPKVNHFLQESAGSSEKDNRRRSSPEPLVEEYKRWMTWRAWVHDTPGWWQKLAEVPGVDDHQELAQKAWASFKLPGGLVSIMVWKLPSSPTSTAMHLPEEFPYTA